MPPPLGHERQLTFFKDGGHDHDGENSSPVVILPGAISLFHLNPALIDWIQGEGGGSAESTGGTDSGVMPVPDLTFQTPPIAPGASYSASLPWTEMCFVRFMRVIMTQSTECTITFYHSSTYADEDREFRATRCGNKFMWEGAWAHYDEGGNKEIHYTIENTGNASAVFQLTLKSGTMAANAYARFVEAIRGPDGEEVTGTVEFQEGNGVTITRLESGYQFSATGTVETLAIRQWALAPTKPTAFTASSGAIGSASVLSSGANGTATFGSNTQWIMADLGSSKTLGKIVVKFPEQSDGRVYKDVKVETSVDGSTWTLVKSTGDVWCGGEGLTVERPTGQLARYVRVWSNGSTTNTTNQISKIIPYVISDNG